MRSDIKEMVVTYQMTHINPNYSALVRQYNADRITVKRAFMQANSQSQPVPIARKSILDPYKELIKVIKINGPSYRMKDQLREQLEETQNRKNDHF